MAKIYNSSYKKRQLLILMKKNLHENLKQYIPITPSLRQKTQVNYFKVLENNKKFKKLIKGKTKKGGRNSFGRLTAFKKGGGHKKSYRFLSLYDVKKHLPFFVINSIEYDPFRNSFINGCFFYQGGFFQYIIAAQNARVGNVLAANYYFLLPYEGSPCHLRFARVGDFLFNLNLNINHRYIVARSAGTFCKLMKKDIQSFFSKVVLPSGNIYTASLSALGFIGKVSNFCHRFINLAKAGRKRWLGLRPSVRGVAMNPVDHPHGGGEGKSSGGRPSCSPWGFYTKGKPTVKKKNLKFFVRKLKNRKKK